MQNGSCQDMALRLRSGQAFSHIVSLLRCVERRFSAAQEQNQGMSS